PFRRRGQVGHGHQPCQPGHHRAPGLVADPDAPNTAANWAVVVGFLTASLLFLMRLNFFWWPFHPIGYAISGSWSINLVWMPLFIAWLLKLIVLRYGGLRLYRAAVPFFLGLTLGQCIVGSLWSLIGILLGIPTYSFWGG